MSDHLKEQVASSCYPTKTVVRLPLGNIPCSKTLFTASPFYHIIPKENKTNAKQ